MRMPLQQEKRTKGCCSLVDTARLVWWVIGVTRQHDGFQLRRSGFESLVTRFQLRPRPLTAKTPASHSGNGGSIPSGATDSRVITITESHDSRFWRRHSIWACRSTAGCLVRNQEIRVRFPVSPLVVSSSRSLSRTQGATHASANSRCRSARSRRRYGTPPEPERHRVSRRQFPIAPFTLIHGHGLRPRRPCPLLFRRAARLAAGTAPLRLISLRRCDARAVIARTPSGSRQTGDSHDHGNE